MLKPLQAMVASWRPGSEASGPSGDPFEAIARGWAAIAGETVARNSQPLSLERGALVVATRSSAWSQQLHLLSETILGEIAALPGAPPVERLVFRSGRLRPASGPGRHRPLAAPGGGRAAKGPDAGAAPEARDEREAFERLRARVTRLQRSSGAACAGCGAPLVAGMACAPCRGRARDERREAVQRLMYGGSAVDFESARGFVTGLERDEYEAARRQLLHRWRLALERARIRGKVGRDRHELRIAGAYVLLQSKLPPERVSDAIVRNALGEALYAFLYPAPGAT